MTVPAMNSTNIPMGEEEGGRRSQVTGGRQRLKTETEAIETDSGTVDLWPYFSQESSHGLLGTIATSPLHALPLPSVNGVLMRHIHGPLRSQREEKQKAFPAEKAEGRGREHSMCRPRVQTVSNPVPKEDIGQNRHLWLNGRVYVGT